MSPENPMSQPDSTSRPAVFVTGAAAGIGRAIAARFARQGWTVGLYDIDAEAVRATAAELGGHTVTGCFDVTDPAGWEQALKEFADATGRLDVLVNNAGILYSGAFGELPIERHHRLVDVNVKGVLNGCHTALPTCAAPRAAGSSISPRPRRSTASPVWPPTARPRPRSAASPRPSTWNGGTSASRSATCSRCSSPPT